MSNYAEEVAENTPKKQLQKQNELNKDTDELDL